MNTVTATPPPAVYPQPSWLPKPLVIHPSIPDDLAREMLRVADLFHAEPHLYRGMIPFLTVEKCGCICAHVTMNEHPAVNSTPKIMLDRWPYQNCALNEIFSEAAVFPRDTPWAIARITRFLESAT